MIALQSMQSMNSRDGDNPLSNVTNGSTALIRTPQTFDAISNQILSLTGIATSLQREMAQLSRRSKDNATDLISLKEATNARDEDIRKCLRELVASLSEAGSRSSSTYGNGGFILDNKAHTPSSRAVKTFTLPRIPSPTSFSAALDRESTMSPRPYNIEGAASIALLEKILREMSTQEGQEMLVTRLAELADRVAKEGTTTAKKLEELLQFIKNNSNNGTLVSRTGGGNGNGNSRTGTCNFNYRESPKLELDYDGQSGPIVARVENLRDDNGNNENMGQSNPSSAADIINEDILKIIRSVKDSVAQGGGLTAEVKALVRELRGEVLGMGREIGRKIDHANSGSPSAKDTTSERERIASVVQDGLEDLKQHMDHVMRESRRQSSSSSISRTTVDGQEVYNAVKSALVNFQSNLQPTSHESSVSKEDIIEAVKEAWENYKPEIEVQHFGLERDELLACLKEGIQEYTSRPTPGATREEVFAAVVEGLKHFSPPHVDTEASLSRDEILDTVRECLEEFEFPSAPSVVQRDVEITKDDMVDAVREGLSTFDFPTHTTALSREVGGNITRDDIYDAVRACLESYSTPSDRHSQQVLALLQDIMGTMRGEFKAVSDEAKQNVAAHGRDTEQVLDATKDGLENLRASIESYVDHAVDISGRHEIADRMSETLDGLRAEIEVLVSKGSEVSLGGIRAEFENLRETMATSMVRGSVSTSSDTEQVLDATKDGLENLRASIESYVDRAIDISGRQEVTDRMSEIFDGIRAEIEVLVSKGSEVSLGGIRAEFENLRETMATSMVRGSVSTSSDTEQVLDATKDGLENLRASIESYVDRAIDISGRQEVTDRMSEIFDGLRAEIEALVSKGSEVSLGGIRAEFENLRETITTSMVRGSVSTTSDTAVLDEIRAEFENLREAMATSIVRSGTNTESETIIRMLKENFDGLRADIGRPSDGNESVLSGTGEILDAFHEGLSGLRTEMEKMWSKPVDMTVNYDILDTLKDGLETVRADIDRLRENVHSEQEVAEISDGAVVTAESLKRNDIENLEVLITQLRIKVEALESMPSPPQQTTPDILSREDIANVEEALRNVQISVDEIPRRGRSVDGDVIRKEDVEAIETLLRNTKAKIDDIGLEETAKKSHLDAVEEIVREAHDNINEIVSRLSDISKREDVNAIEIILKDVIFGLEEVKERLVNGNDDAERVTKTDIEVVEAACLDIKTQIEQMVTTDLAALSSKNDVKSLEELIKEFKGRTELHGESNAKAMEERQAEIIGVGERVSEIKVCLEDFREVVKEKLDEGSTSIEALGKFLEGLGDTIQNANTTEDIKELFETMKAEFEKSNAGVVGAKLELDENFQKTWDRFDEKIDEKFNEVMNNYDDVKSIVKASAKAGEEKFSETESVMLATKTVIEELKLLTDTLGITLTDYVGKVDGASNTVLNRVADTYSLVETTHADTKAEHQITREQMFKLLTVTEGTQGHLAEYNPEILESIRGILSIVEKHYEHSKISTSSIQEKIAEKASISQILDQPLLREAPAEKYDDALVHEKLDKLVEYMSDAEKSPELEVLGRIHHQVLQTAAEVSGFVSCQRQRIDNEHEEKERAVDAARIELEKQLTQRELVEAEVNGLKEEKDHLGESISVLEAEKEDLVHQKMRLAADVSSLETALRIRREELHAMEARAERLERRILEGVIDHSRALLITRSNKGPDAMNLKRVPSSATSFTGSMKSASTVKSRASRATQNAIRMAIDGNRAMTSQPINNPLSTSRRILSLSQITHNVPTGGFKRSHSVKTSAVCGSLRKSSWGGSMNRKEYGELNKENLALKESEEHSDDISDAGTMRRNSIDETSGFGTGTEMTESIAETEYSDEVSETLIDENGQMVLYGERGQEV